MLLYSFKSESSKSSRIESTSQMHPLVESLGFDRADCWVSLLIRFSSRLKVVVYTGCKVLEWFSMDDRIAIKISKSIYRASLS